MSSRGAGVTRAGLGLEQDLWGAGYRAVAGVDEAGRGAWAGPVVAAAVILPAEAARLQPLLGVVDDSKRLTPAARGRCFDLIVCHAIATGVGSAPAQEVDRLGIAPATLEAMRQALGELGVPPDFVLVDYLTLPGVRCPQRGVIHGDAISLSIAAASVLAKVTRDRWMSEYGAVYAPYGFARHKGYGTAEHRAALERLGPCPLHRLTFRPVADMR